MPNLTRSVLGPGVIKSGVAVVTGPGGSTIAGGTGLTDPIVLLRLGAIRALLKTMGVTDISTLGTLSLSGNLLVQGGLTTPPPTIAGGGGAAGGGVVGVVGVGGLIGPRRVAAPVTPTPTALPAPVSFGGARQLSKLADGAIREQGTHAQLVALGGRYAELFELQAAGYR